MLTTTRLDELTELRLLELQHAPEFFALVERSRVALSEFLPWVDRVKTLDDARAWIQQRLDRYANGEHLSLGIWHAGAHGGGIMFRSIDHALRQAEIGYWLDEALVGRGIITRACRLMIDHAFGDLRLDRIVIQCAAGNARSRAIPLRLGFRLEATLPDDFKHRGISHDSVVYGLRASQASDASDQAPHAALISQPGPARPSQAADPACATRSHGS